jgi:hypothetical protein
MVRGETAQHDVERVALEREFFSGGLADDDVGQTAFGRRPRDFIKHALGYVARDHLGHQGRGAVTDVAATTPQV